jgi:hypothetical protein
MKLFLLIALLSTGVSLFAQVETTCNINGSTAKCNSVDIGAEKAEKRQEIYDAGAALGQIIGSIPGRTAKLYDNKDIEFCVKNPASSIRDKESPTSFGCKNYLAFVRIMCSVEDKLSKACKLAEQ